MKATLSARTRLIRQRRVPGLNRQVLLFLGHSLLFHIGLLGIADILLNFYMVSIGYDTTTISLLQSLPRLSGFLIGLPIGLVANRVGNRRLIVLSTGGLALSVAATALTPNLLVIGISRFCWGACFGANQVVKSPFMVTLTDRSEHTAQFSYHNLVSMFSVAIGSVLGGLLPILMSQLLTIEPAVGLRPEEMPLAYRASIIAAAIVLLLSVVPILCLRNRTADGMDSRQERLSLAGQVPWRRVLRLAFPLFVFGLSGGLTFPFFNLIFRELFSISDSAIGSVIGLGWLAMGVMPLFNPVWEARMGRAGALTALMFVSALRFHRLQSVEGPGDRCRLLCHFDRPAQYDAAALPASADGFARFRVSQRCQQRRFGILEFRLVRFDAQLWLAAGWDWHAEYHVAGSNTRRAERRQHSFDGVAHKSIIGGRGHDDRYQRSLRADRRASRKLARGIARARRDLRHPRQWTGKQRRRRRDQCGSSLAGHGRNDLSDRIDHEDRNRHRDDAAG